MTNVILGNVRNSALNEGFGDGNPSFKDVETVIGPDGTIYDTKFIINAVNYSCNILAEVTHGTVTKYLAALPIIYTFQIPTMATDQEYIYINPGFVMHLYELCNKSYVGIAFVLLHEVYHNLFMHFQRRNADPAHFSDNAKCNMAMDYEINWVIEHSFPDPRAGFADSEVDPDDSPFDKDGNPIQLFNGVTDMIGGLCSSEFSNKIWEEIYDLLSQPAAEKGEENTSTIIPTTPDFDDGYRDGWNDVIREARAQGLLESIQLTITNDFIDDCIRLLESAGLSVDTYDAGYDKGRQAALDALKSIFNQSGESPFNAPSPDRRFQPISGLETMKPINPPAKNGNDSKSGHKDPNTPIEMPQNSQNQSDQQNQSGQQGQKNQSGKQDQQNQQGQSGQNGQQGQPGQDGADDNATGDEQNGQDTHGNQSDKQGQTGDVTDKITSVEQATAKANSGKSTIRVGTSDGSFTGKDSMHIGDHVISKSSGKSIREKGGYENNTDPNYGGKDKSPFDEGNWDALKKSIRDIQNKASTIGSFGGRTHSSGPGQGKSGVIDKIIEQTDLILAPIVDWKEELKERIDGTCMKEIEIGWNKKGVTHGIYNRFNDYEGDDINNLILMIDTSGSVFSNTEYVTQVFTEIRDIAASVNPRYIDLVLFCDGIYYSEKIEGNDDPDITGIIEKNKRTGGTSYKDCFRYIQRNYIDEQEDFGCCIIFTDTDITYCGDELPREQDLEWYPGENGSKDGKLIWFILNDTDKGIELPYGSIIETTTDDFLKRLSNFELKESVKTVRIPRRSAK